MRSFKKFFAGFTLFLAAFSCQTAMADIEFYEIDVYVVGTGSTPQEAADNAMDNLFDLIVDIQDSLPANEWLEEWHIPSSGYINPTTFYIEGTIIIGVDTGSSGGGGGGSGGGGGAGGS